MTISWILFVFSCFAVLKMVIFFSFLHPVPKGTIDLGYLKYLKNYMLLRPQVF